jgi:hypothetical protein
MKKVLFSWCLRKKLKITIKIKIKSKKLLANQAGEREEKKMKG